MERSEKGKEKGNKGEKIKKKMTIKTKNKTNLLFRDCFSHNVVVFIFPAGGQITAEKGDEERVRRTMKRKTKETKCYCTRLCH